MVVGRTGTWTEESSLRLFLLRILELSRSVPSEVMAGNEFDTEIEWKTLKRDDPLPFDFETPRSPDIKDTLSIEHMFANDDEAASTESSWVTERKGKATRRAELGSTVELESNETSPERMNR